MKDMFIKGHLHFTLDGQAMEFIHQPISLWGVGGLPWAPLDPEKHTGKVVEVTLKIITLGSHVLNTKAMLLRERSATSDTMCVKFFPSKSTADEISMEIQKHGTIPSNYARKYPRIPMPEHIASFPRTANLKSELFSGVSPSSEISVNVLNLSPNGVLLSSPHPVAKLPKPGTPVELRFDPHGWFPAAVEVKGVVRRTMDEFSLEPGKNVIHRHMGIQFTQVSEVNKAVFMELLKDILVQLKKSF